jgi:poly-gamma-glutamate capsule biosynthesis protein CapA/YwtB (metallophosphatase superfamily)
MRFAFLFLLMLSAQAFADPVRLVFVGDVMLDDGPGKVVAAGRDPLAPFATLLADADYRIANLECPLATTGTAIPTKIYTFRADPRATRVLKGRFDAVSVANNHSGDYGRAAFMETLSVLDGAGIRYFGGGRNLVEAHAPLWIEQKGLRIAVLGYDEFLPRAFEAGADFPGIAWSEDSHVIADIRAARAAGADIVIPFMHWGWEYEDGPNARQRQLAYAMIDAGADAVVGGHPHVTQSAEVYRGKPIIYSLGNFVFDGFDAPEAKLGWLLRMEIDKGGVSSWLTFAARMDEEGTPHPDPATATPCGRRGLAAVELCHNR